MGHNQWLLYININDNDAVNKSSSWLTCLDEWTNYDVFVLNNLLMHSSFGFCIASDMFMLLICVLQLSYDLTWQKLKEKFSHCGMSLVRIAQCVQSLLLNLETTQTSCWHFMMNAKTTGLAFIKTLWNTSECIHCSFLSTAGQVMFAEIKMENGKSKGCGTVRFDSAESAEKACRMMNGTKINGREVDVRIDRNA